MSLVALREKAGSQVLAWIDREFLRFDPFGESVRIQPDEASQTAVCEFALLTLVLRRQARFALDVRTGRWLEYIVNAYLHPAFHTYVFFGHPLAFTGHLIVWLAVTSHVEEFPVTREELQSLVDIGKVTSAERPLHRTVELRYFLDLGRFRHCLPSYRTLFEQTFLAHLKGSLDCVTGTDVYAATHIVFYLTDFGAKLPWFLDNDSVKRIQEYLCCFLDVMIEDRHWDLVAELLLALQCLDSQETPMLLKGWQALLQAQDESGAILEGPGGSTIELAPGAALNRDQFLALYHRSFVTALAAYLGRVRGEVGRS